MDESQRWARAMEWPLTTTALVFLVAYAVPIAAPQLPAWVAEASEVVVWLAWAFFAFDYAIRFVMAPRKWPFVKSNLLDLAVVALPLLRPLRLIRLLALVSILHRTGTNSLRGKVVIYTVGSTILLVIVGSLAITDAERGEPGANIMTWGDGLWWALSTITTVGYGDRFPVSLAGRIVAAALMIGGIALLGVVTATIASWLVQRVSEVSEIEEAATRAQVDLLTTEVAGLRADLIAISAQWPGAPGSASSGVSP
ncbi:MAG: potassium channel family protein [Propionicimonas sp.]